MMGAEYGSYPALLTAGNMFTVVRRSDMRSRSSEMRRPSAPEIAIAVVPAMRGLGVGSALVDELIARCTGSHEALTLNVHQRNPAIRLYQRKGFQVLGQGRSALGIAMRRHLL